MKKIIFILNLILVFQASAEEKEIDYSKYIEFIDSDILWTKDVITIFDTLSYTIGDCNTIERATVAIKKPGETADANKFIQALQNKLINYTQKNFKSVIDYQQVGMCHIGTQYFFLLKKSGWFYDSWIVRQVINFTANSSKEMDIEFAATMGGGDTNNKQRLDKWYSYEERDKHVFEICKIVTKNLGKERVIKECREQFENSK